MPNEQWTVTSPQTITVDDVTSLRAGIVGGRLDVIVHNSPHTVLEVSEISGDPLEVSLDGGRLEVRHQLHGPQGWFKNLMGTLGGSSDNRAVVSLAVPPGVRVEIGTVTGDGLVSGASGVTKLNTVSGSVYADGTVGEMHINTVSGDVIVRGHRGVLTAKTVSGEVTASGDLQHLRANSVSGDLSFDSTGFCRDLGANTVTGDLTVRIPHDVGVEISVNSPGGSVLVDDQRFETYSGKLQTILGPDLQLMTLRANTVSGNVAVVHRPSPAEEGAAPTGNPVHSHDTPPSLRKPSPAAEPEDGQ